MTEAEDIESLIARIDAFGWHEKKREANLRTHGIDFADVKGIFDGTTVIRRSDRYGEIRYQAFGIVEGREVAVAFTVRDDICWLISARRARKDERRKYYGRLEGRAPAGKD